MLKIFTTVLKNRIFYSLSNETVRVDYYFIDALKLMQKVILYSFLLATLNNDDNFNLTRTHEKGFAELIVSLKNAHDCIDNQLLKEVYMKSIISIKEVRLKLINAILSDKFVCELSGLEHETLLKQFEVSFFFFNFVVLI